MEVYVVLSAFTTGRIQFDMPTEVLEKKIADFMTINRISVELCFSCYFDFNINLYIFAILLNIDKFGNVIATKNSVPKSNMFL